jgi:hypothetical protein
MSNPTTFVRSAPKAAGETIVDKPAPVLVARDIVKDLGKGAGLVRALKGVSLELYP